ncbi:MAG: tRNA preQ1(34) S-adenosylmethionine ribosyltransferase-isomerase QueA [Litorilinea sp.]
MKTSLFDYHLPPARIAQTPVEPRDASRLLVLDRKTGAIEHRHFRDIGDYLHAPDILVGNDSRVIPARLAARKATGGQAEVFLLQALDDAGTTWRCLVRGRNLHAGATLTILPQKPEFTTATSPSDLPHSPHASTYAQKNPGEEHTSKITATIQTELTTGVRVVTFSQPVHTFIDTYGAMPLPPYITGYQGDGERYQTVYSRPAGSVAAPTAGLHFTPELLLALRDQGIRLQTVTLHVGLDTFRPVEVEDATEHPIHTEWAELTAPTAHAINEATLAGGRTVAIGTTAVRTLEWSAQSGTASPPAATAANHAEPDADACPWRRVTAFSGSVDLFIRPGYRFRAVDALITNFHLPRSTLLMLVSAFAGQLHPHDNDIGRQMILAAYQEAIEQEYRFYSFGDAMLII